jgi:formate dehydrogenase subunit gamma
MREQTKIRKPRDRRRVVLVAVAISLLAAMVLPLTGYLAYETGLVQVAAAQEDEKEDEANPRAEYWRAVRGGVEGYSAVSGPEAGVLIQSQGEDWRQARNNTILVLGGWFLVLILAAIAANHLITGGDKLEGGRTGRMILRWSAFDRALHWFVGISFVVLAITGLSLSFGRTVLIPLMGKQGFAAWAQLAKPVHDYLSVPFAVAFIFMLLMLIPKNILKGYDFAWLASLGGRLGKGHPSAGFINAGEKIMFWLMFFGGAALVVSGFFLLFPNLDFSRGAMQLANIVHVVIGLFLIGIAMGHIYLGTVGTEGAWEGMYSGEVDEAFAKQHHDLWYEEVKGGTATSESAPAGDVSTATPT